MAIAATFGGYTDLLLDGLRKSEKRLQKAQRRLSKKFRKGKKQSKNYHKQRVKVAKLHLKVSRQRKDKAIKDALALV